MHKITHSLTQPALQIVGHGDASNPVQEHMINESITNSFLTKDEAIPNLDISQWG